MVSSVGLTESSPDKTQYLSNLYVRYKNFMFYIAMKYTRNPCECEDIVQDAILRLMQNISCIMMLEEPTLRSYIALTVKSVYLDHARIQKRLSVISYGEAGFAEPSNLVFSPSIDTKMEIEFLIQKLPERDWIALKSKYILGYNQDEIGALLDIAPDSVRTVISRARRKARAILDSYLKYN